MPWIIKGQNAKKYKPSKTYNPKLNRINNNNTFTFPILNQKQLQKIFGKSFIGRFVVHN